jgi:hypothetical protein
MGHDEHVEPAAHAKGQRQRLQRIEGPGGGVADVRDAPEDQVVPQWQPQMAPRPHRDAEVGAAVRDRVETGDVGVGAQKRPGHEQREQGRRRVFDERDTPMHTRWPPRLGLGTTRRREDGGRHAGGG